MTKDNKDNNITADTAEMTTNQYAYQNPTDKNDIIVINNEGHASTTTTIRGKVVDIDQLNVPKEGKSVLYRTDVDEYNTKYKTSDLQTHNTYSGLDITTYSVYSGFKELEKEPNRVIVGVAGTDLSTSTDMKQNLNLALSRSSFNHLTDSDLQKLKDKTRRVRTNEGEWIEIKNTDANLYYEIEMRQKVQALQKYRENGVPITMVGDSKGGEDVAYLALSFVKSTVKTPEGGSSVYEHADFTAVNLYLTNPKGIRVSDEDYHILEKMASQGKVTVEVVYPEILSKFLIDHVWREIPYSAKIYTVPNQLRASVDNHKIGGYEENVYQGFGGNYKFQCDDEPTEMRELSDYADPALGMQVDVKVGYRYVVSRVTDKSGKTMSVNDYFFEEQTQQVKKLNEKIGQDILQYSEFNDEQIIEYFTAGVRQQKAKLKHTHQELIRQGAPFSAYLLENEVLISSEVMTKGELQNHYNRLLEGHVDEESYAYDKAVRKRVERQIETYKERICNEITMLKQRRNRLEYEVIPSIEEAKQKFQKSQEQITLVIEKRM